MNEQETKLSEGKISQRFKSDKGIMDNILAPATKKAKIYKKHIDSDSSSKKNLRYSYDSSSGRPPIWNEDEAARVLVELTDGVLHPVDVLVLICELSSDNIKEYIKERNHHWGNVHSLFPNFFYEPISQYCSIRRASTNLASRLERDTNIDDIMSLFHGLIHDSESQPFDAFVFIDEARKSISRGAIIELIDKITFKLNSAYHYGLDNTLLQETMKSQPFNTLTFTEICTTLTMISELMETSVLLRALQSIKTGIPCSHFKLNKPDEISKMGMTVIRPVEYAQIDDRHIDIEENTPIESSVINTVLTHEATGALKELVRGSRIHPLDMLILLNTLSSSYQSDKLTHQLMMRHDFMASEMIHHMFRIFHSKGRGLLIDALKRDIKPSLLEPIFLQLDQKPDSLYNFVDKASRNIKSEDFEHLLSEIYENKKYLLAFPIICRLGINCRDGILDDFDDDGEITLRTLISLIRISLTIELSDLMDVLNEMNRDAILLYSTKSCSYTAGTTNKLSSLRIKEKSETERESSNTRQGANQNDITSFSEGALAARVSQRSRLDISCYQLRQLPVNMRNPILTNLRDLDLSLNMLTDVTGINILENLEKLDVSGNLFFEIPKSLNWLPRLKHLNIAFNYIGEASYLNIPCLECIDLRGNQFVFFPSQLKKLGNLKRVHMSYNDVLFTSQDSAFSSHDAHNEAMKEKRLEQLMHVDFQPFNKRRPTEHTFLDKRSVRVCLFVSKRPITDHDRELYLQLASTGYSKIKIFTHCISTLANEYILKKRLRGRQYDLCILSEFDENFRNHLISQIQFVQPNAKVVVIDSFENIGQSEHNIFSDFDCQISVESALSYVDGITHSKQGHSKQTPLLEKQILHAQLLTRARLRSMSNVPRILTKEENILPTVKEIILHVGYRIENITHSEQSSPITKEIREERTADTLTLPEPVIGPLSFTEMDEESNTQNSALPVIVLLKSHYLFTMEVWFSSVVDTVTLINSIARYVFPGDVTHENFIIGNEKMISFHISAAAKRIRMYCYGTSYNDVLGKVAQIKKYMEAHMDSYLCMWQLCPLCWNPGDQNSVPCRAITADVLDMEFAYRKTHAFCIASSPARIIPAHLILPMPKEVEEDKAKGKRPSYEGQIANLSKERLEASKDVTWHRNLKEIINRHSSWLFEKHSNLNVISASPVQSRNGGDEITKRRCIVLYCSEKGTIPKGEDAYPTCLEGVKTDVREGFFQFSMPQVVRRRVVYDAKHIHNPLKIGASISKKGENSFGTLGGFVEDVNDSSIRGILTCCHVLFKETQSDPQNQGTEHVMSPQSTPNFATDTPDLMDSQQNDPSPMDSITEGAVGGVPESPMLGDFDLFPHPDTGMPSLQSPMQESGDTFPYECTTEGATSALFETPGSGETPALASYLPVINDEVVQPADPHLEEIRDKGQIESNTDMTTVSLCGNLAKYVYGRKSLGGKSYFLDAAFIHVKNRDISDGGFVELTNQTLAYIRPQLPIHTDDLNFNATEAGEISASERKNPLVYKCGCATGLRKGELSFNGAAVRPCGIEGLPDVENEFENMIEIVDSSLPAAQFKIFAEAGDSGSLVFSISNEGGEKRVKILGLYVGQNVRTKTYLAIPILPILDHLQVKFCQFTERSN